MRFSIRISKCAYDGKREIQQDSIACTDASVYAQKGMLAVLSDGIGGMKDGEVYSRLAVEAMKESFEASDGDAGLCERLARAYESARSAARQACGDPEDPEGGATVVAVAIQDGRCAFLSVGDSRIYLMRGGEMILLNREQTLGVSLDEYAAFGYIDAQDAAGNTRRKSLTNHLCEPRDRSPDMCAEPFQLQAGDRLALMSDGVFSALNEDEICEAMQMSPAKIAPTMIDMVKEKDLPKQDNSSVITVAVMNRRKSNERRGGK